MRRKRRKLGVRSGAQNRVFIENFNNRPGVLKFRLRARPGGYGARGDIGSPSAIVSKRPVNPSGVPFWGV